MHKILSYLLLTTRNIIFHFFLSIQFTVLPIVTVIFFDMTFSCDYSFSLLSVTEHNGSFIQSSLSYLWCFFGCFVKNWKCEKLFIKIIFSVPTSFSSTDTHTQYHALYLQLSSQKINLQKSAVSLHKDIKLFAFFFPLVKIKSKQERWEREKSLLQNFNIFPCWAEEKGFQKSFWKIKDLNNQTTLLMSHCFSLFKPKAWPLVVHILSNWLNSKLLNVLEMFV